MPRAFGGLSSSEESGESDVEELPAKRLREGAPSTADEAPQQAADEAPQPPPAAPDEATAAVEAAPRSEAAPSPVPESDVDGRRLRLELEYLHFLAQHNYLESAPFLAYLEYLTYWKRPEYTRFIEYPHCLAFLDMLIESAPFRAQLKYAEYRDFVHRGQFDHWRLRHADMFKLVDDVPDFDAPPPTSVEAS